jgi:hypothetical protein
MQLFLLELQVELLRLAVAVAVAVTALLMAVLMVNLVVLVAVVAQIRLQDKNMAVQELLDKEIVAAIVRQVDHFFPALVVVVLVRKV